MRWKTIVSGPAGWRIPMIAPFARQAFEMISKNRHAISRWLSHDRPEEIAGELKKVPLAPCAVPDGTVSDYLR